jgi:uncharacterized protein YpmB
MKKYTYILTVLFAIICAASTITFAQSETPKFDAELMSDFSKGMGGDEASLEKAFKKAEQILAANPKDAQTLVWVGSATLTKAGKSFMSGNIPEGGKLWKEGRTKIDEAVTIDGENLEVLIVRGSTYLGASQQFPIKEEADRLRTLAVADLEKIITLTDGKTDGKSVGIRQQAIKQFVNFYTKTGDKEKAEIYQKMLAAK